MSEAPLFPKYELSELLQILKPYQKESIDLLIDNYGEEEAAKRWLSANGPSVTQKFGGQQQGNAQPFWDSLIFELRLFICSDKKYKKEREQLLSSSRPAALFAVSTISVAIATTLGIAASLIVPVVAVMLGVIGKIGVNAWCAVS